MFQESDWEPVTSSNIKASAYNPSTQTLGIQFSNGTRYAYAGVTPEVMAAAKQAESLGKFFHSDIKGKFESSKLEPVPTETEPPPGA